MKLPLSRFAPSPSLALRREGDAPSAAGRPLRGGAGLGLTQCKESRHIDSVLQSF